MKKVKNKLSRQLIWLVGLTFVVLFILLGIVLPKLILPVAENNVYSYLSEPLKLVNNDNFDSKLLDTEIAYIYVVGNNVASTSNLKDIIKVDNLGILLDKMTDSYGKFTYNHKNYYYYTIKSDRVVKIALSDDSYINKTKSALLGAIFPIVLFTCLLIGVILTTWSSFIVRKIEKLKNKIDNIDNPDYNHTVDFETDDEIRSLALAIEDMRLSLINQEEYRNQMYQNISHDFKTPLTVIKSYIEAYHDDMEDASTVLTVISEQTEKLELKVHSLLYLNKLDYLKNNMKKEYTVVDMEKIVAAAIREFKFRRRDVKFIVSFDKNSKFYGTEEYFETIIDNLLANFLRYADKTIKITAKNNRLTLYNDGPNIDSSLLDGIFTPFRKGIKGEFGLGLSIVKKTLLLMDYDITIKNEKKGVSFHIFKTSNK